MGCVLAELVAHGPLISRGWRGADRSDQVYDGVCSRGFFASGEFTAVATVVYSPSDFGGDLGTAQGLASRRK